MRDGAAIIIVGNEILSGKVSDSNSAFLIAQLRELGMPVRRVTVIPDEVDTIAETVRDIAHRYAQVFSCGGVGPTLDDVTLEGIARAFEMPLVTQPNLENVVRSHFRERTQPSHLKMALLPSEHELVWCEGLPWPVIIVRNVMVLPGDPGILERKFLAIRERFRSIPFVLRRVFTTLEEGELAPHLDAIHEAHPGVAIGSYPVYDRSDYSVQLTLESKEREPVERALAELMMRLDPSAIVRLD